MDADAEAIRRTLENLLPNEEGFETYPFRIGAYNAAVGPEFQLPYGKNTMAVLILSTPDMFDVAFRNWMLEMSNELGGFDNVKEEVRNPISQFMDSRLTKVLDTLTTPVEVIHDHSLWPNRKPKVLMCTCGHVAGAAYYYQPKDLLTDSWPPARPMEGDSKFIGLSLHPVYGGHFAFRSVLIFPGVELPDDFKELEPKMAISVDDARNALELFNFSWRDSRFRDAGIPARRYSETQTKFFGTPPARRWEVIRHWVENQNTQENTDVQ